MRLGALVLGSARLRRSKDGHTARGVFEASEVYDLVRPVFRLYTSATALRDPVERDAAIARYEKARAALKLQLIDASGNTVPMSSLHISDPGPDDALEGLQLEVRLSVGPE